MPHRIFVTGGTGFLGSHFIRAALEKGYSVSALRRPGSRPRLHLDSEPRWLEGSLSDAWNDTLRDCDSLVHFAAVGVSPQKATWSDLLQTNVLDSLHLWQAAAGAGIKRMVICGSCFEYGSSGNLYDLIPVEAPLRPITAYGASKAAATMAALALAAEKNLELLVLRPFHIFGDGQHESNFWPALKRAALSGEDFPMTAGTQVRDFLPVADAASAFLAALDRPDLLPGQPRVENLGSGHAQTLREFASFWWDHWQATGNIREGALPLRVNEVTRYVPRLDPVINS